MSIKDIKLIIIYRKSSYKCLLDSNMEGSPYVLIKENSEMAFTSMIKFEDTKEVSE